MNLVDWQMVCNSKESGGLGIKQAVVLNRGYMMKLTWQFLFKPNAL